MYLRCPIEVRGLRLTAESAVASPPPASATPESVSVHAASPAGSRRVIASAIPRTKECAVASRGPRVQKPATPVIPLVFRHVRSRTQQRTTAETDWYAPQYGRDVREPNHHSLAAGAYATRAGP